MKILGLNLFQQKRGGYQKSMEQGGWLWGMGNVTSSGKMVSFDDALKVTAIFCCVKILAEGISTLPLHLYKRLKPKGKERAWSHPLYEILHDVPNDNMDSAEYFSYAMVYLTMRGDLFSRKVYNGFGELTELIPMHPDRVRVEVESNNSPVYIIKNNGKEERLTKEWVFHVKGLSLDGIRGLSVIDYARESAGLALAAEEHGAKFFSNSVTPSGLLVHPQKLGKEAFDRLEQQWKQKYSGSANAHNTLILEEGMKFEAMSLTNEQSQFIETRKFQISDIARWFRVPPHMIGDLERATFSNIEQQSLEFVNYTLRPWIVRFEKAIKRQLLTKKEREKYFAEFLLDGLLRGDSLSRAQKLQIERQNGIINANEWREIENLNPIEGEAGEKYITPLNMDSGSEKEKEEDTEDDDNEDIQEKSFMSKMEVVYPVVEPMLRHQIRKICNRQNKAIEAGNFNSEKEMQFVFADLKPCSDAFAASLRVDSDNLTNKFVRIWHQKIGKNEINNEDFVINLLKNEIKQ